VCYRKCFLYVKNKLHQNLFFFSCARGAEVALLQNFIASINGSEQVKQSPSLLPFLAHSAYAHEAQKDTVMSSLL
jgi:hypothetical protein